MKLVSKIRFAKQLGVHRSQVTRWCEKQLAEGVVQGKVDLDHPVIRRWVDNLQVRADDKRTAAARQATQADEGDGNGAGKRPRPDVDAPDFADFERIGDLTVREIAELFGSQQTYMDYLIAAHKWEDTRGKRLKNDATEGTLISRELVRIHLFGALESMHRRLLGDAPKTIARRIYALAKADVPLEDGESAAKEILSSIIRPVRDKAAKTLDDDSAPSVVGNEDDESRD